MLTKQFMRRKTICKKVANCRSCMFSSTFFDGFCAITKDLQKCAYGNHFVTILKCSVNVFKPVFRGWRAIWPAFSPGALTRKWNCVTFYVVKGFDERHALSVRIPERNPFGARVPVPCGQRYHFPSRGAEMPRRSRPLSRQWVTAKGCNQGGTVEYFVSHPWFCSGDGIFLYPPRRGGNE